MAMADRAGPTGPRRRYAQRPRRHDVLPTYTGAGCEARPMTIPRYQNPLAVLAAVLVAGSCAKPPAVKSPPVPVELAQATSISAMLTVDANGVVEPLQTVSVVPQ